MTAEPVTVAALHRFPVKGLSPERLDSVHLRRGEYVPGDRLYAVENGPAGFDPAEPRHQPKIKFLMLMRNARLATLRTRFRDADATLVITEGGREAVAADLSSDAGRAAVARFFEAFMPEELRGAPRVLSAPSVFRFTDSRSGFVSLIGLGSVGALEAVVGWPVDPLRFRANITLAGLPPFGEFDWVGREIRVGPEAVLRITKRTVRCAATEVDPTTGFRDLDVLRILNRSFGHQDLGVYAEVLRSGVVRPGDRVEPASDSQAELPLAPQAPSAV